MGCRKSSRNLKQRVIPPERKPDVEYRVLSNEGLQEDDIQLDLTQRYVFKVGGAEKTLRSLITLQRGEGGMITLHEEKWNHEPNKVAS